MSAATFAPPGEHVSEYWEDEDCEPVAHPSLIEQISGGSRMRSRSQDGFDLMADELESAMLSTGSTRRVVRHPAYIEILDMGEAAIPFLLERLGRPGARPLWLRLLGSLTAFQPGAGQRSIPDAAAEWIRWGKRSGHMRIGVG